jgi:V8-like Glu-specific endopeptidase
MSGSAEVPVQPGRSGAGDPEDRAETSIRAGHRPIRNTDAPEAVGAPPMTGRDEVAPAAPVVLPYYRPPRGRLRAVPGEGLEESASGDEQPVRDVAEASFGETSLLEAVIGNDDRVRLADPLTRTNPWRQICALRIRATTGASYVGTGWFIGPRVLATAGHCVFLQKEGGWADAIEVIPGKSGASAPYGRQTARRFASVDGWVSGAARDFDYGVIFLDDPALGTRVGNFEVEAALDSEMAGVAARVSGYPADRDRAEHQYYHERRLQRATPTRLLYDIDTFGGQSGSPIWRQLEGGHPVAIGIHTTGGLTSNSGTRISEPVLDNLVQWNEEP